MRCFGEYKRYDRICELCTKTNTDEATQCSIETKRIHDTKALTCVCEYREHHYDSDHDAYYVCSKTGNHCEVI